jgi:hypothetical protein
MTTSNDSWYKREKPGWVDMAQLIFGVVWVGTSGFLAGSNYEQDDGWFWLVFLLISVVAGGVCVSAGHTLWLRGYDAALKWVRELNRDDPGDQAPGGSWRDSTDGMN